VDGIAGVVDDTERPGGNSGAPAGDEQKRG
jgi:hypothetical protein